MNKKSAVVKLGITTAMALALRCGGPRREAQRCVDGNGQVVEDRYCRQGPVGAPYAYHWWYGGSGYYPGERVSGGSDRPTPGTSAVRTGSSGFSPDAAGSVSRGGFGATGEGGGE